MIKNKVQFRLVLQYNHRVDLAEKAIQKSFFKAGLSSLHPDFSIAEQDRLLPQVFLTLNLLRPATANPNLSIHAYLYGPFDFNQIPLVPPGSNIIIHSKPSKRSSWGLNGKITFHVGPAPNHYSCMTCFNPVKKQEIISDTLVFIPHIIPKPSVNLNNFLHQAASDIVTLSHQSKPILPTSL